MSWRLDNYQCGYLQHKKHMLKLIKHACGNWVAHVDGQLEGQLFKKSAHIAAQEGIGTGVVVTLTQMGKTGRQPSADSTGAVVDGKGSGAAYVVLGCVLGLAQSHCCWHVTTP